MSIDLKKIAEQIATQDNRCTTDPIFVVFQKAQFVASPEHDHDYEEWFDKDGSIADKEIAIKLDAGDIDEDEGWRKLSIKEINLFVTACFTLNGAKKYLDTNGHNLRNPFIYVHSLYRNAEMIGLREYILSHNGAQP